MGDWTRIGGLTTLSLQIVHDTRCALDNHPPVKRRARAPRSITLVGQCVAGLRSCVLVPELSLAFDYGFAFDRAMRRASVVCVTHGHVDHVGALHVHAFERAMANASPPTLVMPSACVNAFRTAQRGYRALNYNASPNVSHGRDDGDANDIGLDGPTWMCNAAPSVVVGVHGKSKCSEDDNDDAADHDDNDESPNESNESEAATRSNDEVQLSGGGKGYTVRALRTTHGVPSVAYCVVRETKRLRSEYSELSGSEIARLRVREGVRVTRVHREPVLAYTGDTTIDGVLRHRLLLTVPILMIECTYLCKHDAETSGDDDISPSQARKRGHVHEEHIVANADRFANQHLVLCHFSRRYSRTRIAQSLDRIQSRFGKRVRVHAFV